MRCGSDSEAIWVLIPTAGWEPSHTQDLSRVARPLGIGSSCCSLCSFYISYLVPVMLSHLSASAGGDGPSPPCPQATQQLLVAERDCPLVSVLPTLFPAWPHIEMERLGTPQQEAPESPQQVAPCRWSAKALHQATSWAGEVRVSWVLDLLASPHSPQ